MNFAKEVGAAVIIRGLRAVAGFEYEVRMVGMNRALNDNIEMAFLRAPRFCPLLTPPNNGNGRGTADYL